MKKLLHSLLICFGILMISSQVFAQNAPGEKLQPYMGATYNYKFKGIKAGLDYEFYFSSSSVGKGTLDGTFTGYIQGTKADVVPATGEVSVDVAYPTGASTAAKVYLFLKVYDASDDAFCENYNAVEITPIANNFDVLVTNDLTGDATTSDICPDITGLKAVVAPLPDYADNYDAGKTTMNFRFNRSGSTNDWNLAFSIAQVGKGDYTYSINGGTPVTVTADDDTTNIPSALVSGDAQTLQIVLNNVPGERPEFTITVTGATDNVTLVSAKTPNAKVIETVKIMPKIGAFE